MSLDNNPSLTPQQLAEAASVAIGARDRAAQAFGITLEDIGPGYARTRMTVRADMLNGHDTCHGGVVFTLADTAFAYACNSYNQVTVAAGAAIEFLAPAHANDVLTAVAEERALSGRTGVYDITVRNQNGHLIALFRGNSHRRRGAVASISSAAEE